MTVRIFVTVWFAAAAGVIPALAQHDQHQPGAAAAGGAAAAVTQCAQAQPVVAALLEASLKRLESARQTNNGSAMRDAADDVQSALVDIRTQLAACANMVQPAADPHAGHTTEPAPASPPPANAAPSTPAPPSTPAAPTRGASQPHNSETHSGHTAPAVEAPAAPLAARPPQPSTRGRPNTAAPATSVAELKCKAPVDAKTAPRMLYQGRMYYFCTEASRSEFAKDPSKFVTTGPQSAPAHAH